MQIRVGSSANPCRQFGLKTIENTGFTGIENKTLKQDSFSGYCCAFSDTELIVSYEILGNSSPPVCLYDNHVTVYDGLLAFLKLMLVRSFCCVPVVVFLSLSNLVLIKSNLCRTAQDGCVVDVSDRFVDSEKPKQKKTAVQGTDWLCTTVLLLWR